MLSTPFKKHEPLYLKYRPQSLAELVGQEGVYRTLVNAIEHNRLSHAYLFTGPRGTGKTSSARILAKSLNCKTAGKPTVTPCQTCSCCIEVTLGNSPAVFEIDAASNNSVDDARVLIERAPLVAVGGQYKVYIIDECHMLTKEAFNALLKTIEQPPPNVVFILATTEEHKVLPTIVSRCQRLMFKLINQDTLSKHLRMVSDKEQIEIEDEALKLIARRSGGGLRDALSNLDQASLLASAGAPARVGDLLRLLGALHEDVLLDLSKQVAERDGQSVINSVNQFLEEGREPQLVLQELARHFLALIKANYVSEAGEAAISSLSSMVLGSDSYIKGLLSQVPLFERAELSQIIEHLDRLEQTTRRSSQPAMHLEIGLLSICHRHDIHLLKDLLARIEHLEEMSSGNIAEHVREPRQIQHSEPRQVQQSEPRQMQQSEQRQVQHSEPRQSTTQESFGDRESYSHADETRQSKDIAAALKPVSGLAVQAETLVKSEEISSVALAPEADTQLKQEIAKDFDKAAKSESSAINKLNDDIEYFWQQVLDELQRRHLPTFSLASTHAFPLSIDEHAVTIGVVKENFQKMLETKQEHLRTACQAISGLDLAVRIRVSEAKSASKKNDSSKSLSLNKMPEKNTEKVQAIKMQDSEAAIEKNSESRQNSASESEIDSTKLSEAYKLFEGPGSRRIN